MPVARHETITLTFSSFSHFDHRFKKKKWWDYTAPNLTDFLHFVLSQVLYSFFVTSNQAAPAPILPTFHPASSFPTCSIFPVVLNQTQPPWLISQFLPTQVLVFFFSLLFLMLPVSNWTFIKVYLLPCLVMEVEGSARPAKGYNKILPLLRHLELHQGCFWLLCLENQDR